MTHKPIKKYRKKPVIIEAYQTDKDMDIDTLEGTMHASKGDYIITGVKEERYPCKPDIFEKTYELVGDEAINLWNTRAITPDLVDKISQELQNAGFTDASKWLDCKYEL